MVGVVDGEPADRFERRRRRRFGCGRRRCVGLGGCRTGKAAGVVAIPATLLPLRAAEAEAGVARVVGYADTHDPAYVSRDGRATYLLVYTRAGVDGDDVADRLDRLERDPAVLLGGGAVVGPAVGDLVSEDLARAELLAFPFLFLLSLWVFRGVVAALLPLFVGLLTVMGTFLGLRLVNEVTPLSIYALNLATGLGLGLAIDYSLFVVSRYREELARGADPAEAVRRTLRTAGRTILFSSMTVTAALLALLVFPQRFLYSMGTSGAITAIVACGVSLTALPALLVVLGRRVGARPQDADRRGFWYRLSHAVMRRPVPVAAGAALILVLAGLPFLGIRFTGVDPTVLPDANPAKRVDTAIRTQFPPGRTAPVIVAVAAPASEGPAIAEYARRLGRLPGAAAASPARRLDASTWQIDVMPTAPLLDERTQALVRAVRAAPRPAPVLVGGATADFVDQQEGLGARLPLALAILAVTTLVILFAMTGSVVLPIKALVMNLLTLSAAFGLLVFVFQDGRLEGVLDYTSQGALESTQPLVLLCLAFGLSTDYAVFLLGRIKEAHDAGAPTEEAVATGLQRTGRIVTAAALLFSVAIGAFATSQVIFIKEVGLGTAAAVLIDATIVRALLVPSLMRLLGERNWWAPSPLRRLHRRFGLAEETAAA